MQTKTLRLMIPYIIISATVYPVAKDGLNFGSPFVLMAMRYVLSAVVFLAITKKLFLGRSVILLGFALSFSSLLWVIGLEFVSSGESAVLSYTMPFFAILASALLLHESASRRQMFGAVIGFVGMAIFSVPLFRGFLLIGSLLTVGGAIAWAFYTAYLRKLKDEDNLSVLGTAFLVGSLPFVLGSIVFHDVNLTAEFVVDGLYLSVLGSIVTVYLLSSMVREEKMGSITSMVFAVPAVSLAIQTVQTAVIPSPIELLGCSVMFFGIYVASGR